MSSSHTHSHKSHKTTQLIPDRKGKRTAESYKGQTSTDVSRGDVKGWSKAYMPRIDSDRGRASHRSGDYESGREPHNSTIRMMSPAVGIDDPETYERDLEYFENQGRFSPPSNERLGSEDSQEVRRNHPIAQNRRILTQDSNRRRKYSKSEEHGCCVIL